MRVAFISQWYDPETGSAAIPGTIVRSACARVMTSRSSRPSRTTRRGIFSGYRVRPLMRETLRGVSRSIAWPCFRATTESRSADAVVRELHGDRVRRSESCLRAASRSDVVYFDTCHSWPGRSGAADGSSKTSVRALRARSVARHGHGDGMLPLRLERPAGRVLRGFCSMVYGQRAGSLSSRPG